SDGAGQLRRVVDRDPNEIVVSNSLDGKVRGCVHGGCTRTQFPRNMLHLLCRNGAGNCDRQENRCKVPHWKVLFELLEHLRLTFASSSTPASSRVCGAVEINPSSL